MKMKLGVIVLSASALMNTAALAMDFNPSVYVGAEAQWNRLKGDTSQFKDSKGNSMLHKKNVAGGSLLLGSRFNEYVGAEMGYSMLGKSNSSFTDTVAGVQTKYQYNVKMKNAHIDVLGYVPVANDINLIGSLGLGRLSTKVKLAANNVDQKLTAVQNDAAKTKIGMRVGVGAEYKIDSNISARAMVRYQKGNKTVKNVKSAGLGLFYQF